jgi:catechol 2,3-dioxygenase-like lactoylglutathione lyase family enzyme
MYMEENLLPIEADGIERRTLVFGTVAAMAFPTSVETMAATDGRTQMNIDRFDHVVLTVLDIEATCRFYELACGMKVETFGNGRKALKFGQQKINLHQVGKEIKPYALHPTRGSADFCMITTVPVEDVLSHLKANGIAVEEGIVDRTGAMGPIRSVYIRDPDQNLLEISNYPDKAR